MNPEDPRGLVGKFASVLTSDDYGRHAICWVFVLRFGSASGQYLTRRAGLGSHPPQMWYWPDRLQEVEPGLAAQLAAEDAERMLSGRAGGW